MEENHKEALWWLGEYLLSEDFPGAVLTGAGITNVPEAPGWWQMDVFYDGEHTVAYGLEFETDDLTGALEALVTGVDEMKAK